MEVPAVVEDGDGGGDPGEQGEEALAAEGEDACGDDGEAAAVMQCLREGKLEHPWMTLDESISIMETMDTIRAQWGLKFPME